MGSIASPERGGEPPLGGGGVPPQSVTSSAAMSKPSGGIRSLHSLSAWGLPTPSVAFACIGNVDIQVFSGAGGRLYFIRQLQVYLFIIFHVQPISQGVTLLFFFTEKKKRSKKRKEFAFHLYCKIQVSPEDDTRNYHHRFSPTEIPRRGEQAASAAVTLPFSHLKSGRKVSGDSPPPAPLAKVVEICYNRFRSESVNGFQKKEVQKDA